MTQATYSRNEQAMLSDWIDDMSTPPACTVYFDGDCPVCRTEIAHYRRQSGAEAIAWVDASRCDEAALGPGVDRATVLRRFHVREADGSLASGAAGFVAIWRRLPAFAWLARLASFRPVLAVLESGYRLFLRVRPWWRPAHTAAPAARAAPGSQDRTQDEPVRSTSRVRTPRPGSRRA
jgi:predicted DCC family thiol-disulfide oxidoreductase YuxK